MSRNAGSAFSNISRRGERVHHELHQRPDGPRVGGAGVVHRLLLLEQPPRRHVLARVVVQAQVLPLAEAQVGVAEAEQVDAEAARLVGAADVARR